LEKAFAMSTKVPKTTRSPARKTAAAPAKVARRLPARKAPTAAPARTPSPPANAPVKADKAMPAAKAAKPAKQRVKLVRDSFAMPEADFAFIDALKARAIEARRPAKKSELLRAGLKALHALTPAQLVAALDALTPIKTGRPKRGH
jgi:hypothetical protein